MTPRISLTALLLSASLFNVANACNIPVFRYALERWQPDNFELLVFYDTVLAKQLTSPNETEMLRNKLVGNANLELTFVDVRKRMSDSMQAILRQQSESQDMKYPWLVLRGKHPRGEYTCWTGELAAAEQLVRSPVRTELMRRLLAGHSVVWLTIGSDNTEKNKELHELLVQECESLGDEIDLPEGIGLPGSELYSEVPLFLKFSTLEIKKSDAKELFLLELARGFQPEAFGSDEPLVIPVFGRGRALEVIPASRVSRSLVRDITMFLSGACSCQVKDQNPGFDLLMDKQWDSELFGEDAAPPPATSIRPGESNQQQPPVLLAIPPGKSR